MCLKLHNLPKVCSQPSGLGLQLQQCRRLHVEVPLCPPVLDIVCLDPPSWSQRSVRQLITADKGSPSDPGSDREIDVVSLEVSDDDAFPTWQQEAVMGEHERQSPHLQEIIGRATAALNIELPSDQGPTPSRFDDEVGGQSTRFLVAYPCTNAIWPSSWGRSAAQTW